MTITSKFTWRDLEPGVIISDAGNSREYKTGDWRSAKPVVKQEQCIKCGICYLFCPDMAIIQAEDGTFKADLYYCKGCGICEQECYTGCITMVDEEE